MESIVEFIARRFPQHISLGNPSQSLFDGFCISFSCTVTLKIFLEYTIVKLRFIQVFKYSSFRVLAAGVEYFSG